MAMNNEDLKSLIVAELEGQGIVTAGDHAWAERLATAVANAVVTHVTGAAEVTVSGGSSAGTYKVS